MMQQSLSARDESQDARVENKEDFRTAVPRHECVGLHGARAGEKQRRFPRD
jgi:hypothetical protein